MPVYRGVYFEKRFFLKSHTTGDAIDVTDWTFRAMIRDRLDAETLLELTTANGGLVVIDGPTGEIAMRITAEQSAELPVARVVFDVLRTDASPGPLWIFGGKFAIKEPVTRDG